MHIVREPVQQDEGEAGIVAVGFIGDLEDWRALAVESAAQPEDWSGPVDIVEPDEFGYTDVTDTDTTRAVEAVTTTWQEIVEDDDDLDEDSIH